jgi:glutaredoxin
VPTVDLYARPGCHLCDDARAQLAALAAELSFTLVEHDIEADDDLHRRVDEEVEEVLTVERDDGDPLQVAAVLRERLGRVGGG